MDKDPNSSEIPYICVFCGSMRGRSPAYVEAAQRLGRAIARLGLGLVYGGGRVGLMGSWPMRPWRPVAPVVGVIPEPLALKEIAHTSLTELILVPGMHERKALMAERCSAFLAMPGGVGTSRGILRGAHLGGARPARETDRPAQR